MESIYTVVIRLATPIQKTVAKCNGSVERVTVGYYVWTKVGSRRVSGRGDLETEPQGKWAVMGVQGECAGHGHSVDMRLPGSSRGQGVC